MPRRKLFNDPLPIGFDINLARQTGHYDVITPANAPGAGSFYLLVLEGQNAQPGNVHGFTRQLPGDALTTTVNHRFLLSFVKIDTDVLYQITALQ